MNSVFIFHQKILSSTVEINRSNDYDVMIPWAGKSIVTLNGKKYEFSTLLFSLQKFSIKVF